ncbi:MAG: response regulator [Actinomycetia bacterium]|nr:response regulator [Actinomycetes bacterium]
MQERRAQGTGVVQLDRMLDDLPVAVVILDGQGQQVHANRTFWELFAVPVSRRAELCLPALLHPEEELGEELFGALTAGEAEKVRVSREFVRPDGGEFRGQITAVALELGSDQPWYLCVVDDVSERVSASDELGRLARVVESTSDLVGVLDLSGRVIYLNHAARGFFAVGDTSTASSTDLYTPESIVKFATEIRPVIEVGRTWAGELTMVRADGVVVPVLQSIAPDDQGHGPLRLSVVGRPVHPPELGAGPPIAAADELVVGLAAQLAPLHQKVVAAASEIEETLPGTAGAIRAAASVLDRMVGDLDELLDGADQASAPLVPADPVVVARTLIDELALEGVDLSLEIRPGVPWVIPDSATLEQAIRRALDAVANSTDPAVVRLLPGRGPDAATVGIEVAGPRAADIGDLGLLVLRRLAQRRGGSMGAVTEAGRGLVTIELPVWPVDGLEAPPLPTAETPALATVDQRRSLGSSPVAEVAEPVPSDMPVSPGPAAPAGAPAAPVADAPATDDHPSVLEPVVSADPDPAEPPAGAEVRPEVRPLRVLAVDHNEISQMLVADHLRKLGHRPFLTDCGSTVPDHVADYDPDILLLAVELPDTDGPDLCRYLRASGWTGPILGITADHSLACRDRCQASGMDGLLTKPVELGILGALLEQAMDLCAPSGAHFAPTGAVAAPPPVASSTTVEPEGMPAPVSPPEPQEPDQAPEAPPVDSSTVGHVLDTLALELGGPDRAVSIVEGYLSDFDDQIGCLVSDNRIDAQSAVDGLLSVSAMLGLHGLVEQCLFVNVSLSAGVSHPHPEDVEAVAAVSKVALEAWLAARPVVVG